MPTTPNPYTFTSITDARLAPDQPITTELMTRIRDNLEYLNHENDNRAAVDKDINDDLGLHTHNIWGPDKASPGEEASRIGALRGFLEISPMEVYIDSGSYEWDETRPWGTARIFFSHKVEVLPVPDSTHVTVMQQATISAEIFGYKGEFAWVPYAILAPQSLELSTNDDPSFTISITKMELDCMEIKWNFGVNLKPQFIQFLVLGPVS